MSYAYGGPPRNEMKRSGQALRLTYHFNRRMINLRGSDQERERVLSS